MKDPGPSETYTWASPAGLRPISRQAVSTVGISSRLCRFLSGSGKTRGGAAGSASIGATAIDPARPVVSMAREKAVMTQRASLRGVAEPPSRHKLGRRGALGGQLHQRVEGLASGALVDGLGGATQTVAQIGRHTADD